MTFLSSSELVDWLRLWRLVQQSSQSAARLLDHFSSPSQALTVRAQDWRRVGVAPEKAARLERWQAGTDPALQREMDESVAADMAWCERPGHAFMSSLHPDYPALLREIADPPPLLFLRGDAGLLSLPQLALVVSRQPSLTGRADAEAFAAELAAAGLVITSGLARGIDAAAHTGALRQGKTLAVLGTGADRPYPRENAGLYERIIAAGGLIVSEFLPGTAPLAHHFPRRNRIISGLSLGVLVVEAAPESGSLITARLAAEQGRMVWALPGSRHHVQAQGCLKLIREGVTAVTDSRQILGDLPPLLGFLREQLSLHEQSSPALLPAGKAPAALPDMDATARNVLSALACERRHADWLIDATGESPAAVLRALGALEMAGLVAVVPGGYERVH